MCNTPKIRKTFTVDPNIFKEFAEIADKKSINRSSWIENKMKEFIEDNKNEQ